MYQNTLKISESGRADLKDAISYFGWLGSFSIVSFSNRLTIGFQTGSLPLPSKFMCTLKPIVNDCECGKHNIGKVVGGNEVSQ